MAFLTCISRDASAENLCIPFPRQSQPGAAFWGSWRDQVLSAWPFPQVQWLGWLRAIWAEWLLLGWQLWLLGFVLPTD